MTDLTVAEVEAVRVSAPRYLPEENEATVVALCDFWIAAQRLKDAPSVAYFRNDEPLGGKYTESEPGVLREPTQAEWDALGEEMRRQPLAVLRDPSIEALAAEVERLRDANRTFAREAICEGGDPFSSADCPKAPCTFCLRYQTMRADSLSEANDMLLARAERAEAEVERLREVLVWINRKGGLGLEVHGRIDAALAVKVERKDVDWEIEP